MRIVRFSKQNRQGYALLQAGTRLTARFLDHSFGPEAFSAALRAGPQGLQEFAGQLASGTPLELAEVTLSTPVPLTGKFLCLGANFREHASEAGLQRSKYIPVFIRVPDSITAHEQNLVKPVLSADFDYEGELAVIIGRPGRHIAPDEALKHVAGYSIFNDGSIRDYQLQAAQWTLGKNFHRTGALGPAFVSADELPPGARGLRLQTHLNGTRVQDASLSEMLVDVATAVSVLSGIMKLDPGDVIAMGTPAGVGVFRTPPLYMKQGDICQIEIEGLGVLRNAVVNEDA
jgi:acylpyruvate hydrolase